MPLNFFLCSLLCVHPEPVDFYLEAPSVTGTGRCAERRVGMGTMMGHAWGSAQPQGDSMFWSALVPALPGILNSGLPRILQ